MTYATEKERFGRRPITIVEIDLDFCSRVYGVAPCTAAVGVTGTQKCFNTRKTCQDPAHYNKTVKTYRFSTLPLPASASIQTIPSLISVSIAPTRIDPGQSLGVRASVTASFSDHPHHDRGVDPYFRERTYSPNDLGTFWGKLAARNPYYQGRVMRVLSGFLTEEGLYDAANFQTRTYVIDKIDGPDASGKVRLTAKDVLKLADNDRAQAPALSHGVLRDDITDSDSDVSNHLDMQDGVDISEYPLSGTVCIGTEVCKYTRSGSAVTFERATDGTTIDSHQAGDLVQLCLRYTDAAIPDVVYDLLVTYGVVDAAFIDMVQWNAENYVWLLANKLTTLITKPEGVTTLLNELVEQALFYVWWDERLQTIPFKAIRPADFSETVAIDDDLNILADSMSLTEKPDLRISEVAVYYGQIDPTEKLDKPENYRKVKYNVDLAAEGDDQYGDTRIKKVFSRWLPTDNDSPALTLGARLIARFRNSPRYIKLRLDAKDSDLWTGGDIRLTTRFIQDFTGAPTTVNMQVLEVVESVAGAEYAYEITDSFFQGRYAYVTENDMADYDDATDDQREVNGFISANAAPYFADNTEAYKII